jgi:hypothetical protein
VEAPQTELPPSKEEEVILVRKGGFSWKRTVGISAAKSKISRATGIPFTKSGRQRKVGKVLTGGGCSIILLAGFVVTLTVAWAALF